MPDTPIMLLVVGLALIAALAVAGWSFLQKKKQKSEKLQHRLGPQRGHPPGSKSGAEAEIVAREKRVAQFDIAALEPEDAARMAQAWNDLQARFADDPKGVVVEADALAHELLQMRGFPIGNFERVAAAIALAHAHIVEDYRTAQIIAEYNGRGEADAEDLRSAMMHYRALFDALLPAADPQTVAAE